MASTSDLSALLDTVPLPAGADIVGRDVGYTSDGVAFEGYLAYDAAVSGPRPAVVVVHDWNGLTDITRTRAQMFARLGYAAFAMDVYGAGIRPDHAEAAEVSGIYRADLALWRARMTAGLEAARAQEVVDSDRLVALGYCFGGESTLELARTGADLRGFASFHGILHARGGDGVDAIAAPLLVLTGGSDPLVPDAAVVALQDELRGNPGLDWQVVVYSGAPHAFTVPGDSYREAADRRSWAEIERFLAEVLTD